MYILKDTIRKIKEQTDIVQIIEKYIRLKKHGKYYIGLCPFHQEKIPSFFIYREQKIFKCFGCNEHGDIFTFLQKKTGLLFVEIVQKLAQELKINIQINTNTISKNIKTHKNINLLNYANEFFHSYLLSNQSKTPLNYLINIRKININTIKEWKIGFCPIEKNIFINFLYKIGYSIEQAIESGLLIKSQQKIYLLFLGRIIFPIYNNIGQVIAFAGRTINSNINNIKYINSPKTIFYDKSKVLFGFNKALHNFKNKTPVLVEGYFDVLAINQTGFPSFSCSGTSLTKSHVSIIKTYYKEIILCFDKDNSGQQAEEKALFLLIKAGLKVLSLIINTKDPDELIRLKGKKYLYYALQKPQDTIQRKIIIISKTAYCNICDRRNAINKLLLLLKASKNDLLIYQYIKFAAQILEENEYILFKEVNLKYIPIINNNEKQKNLSEKESLLLKIAIKYPNIISKLNLNTITLLNKELQKFLKLLINIESNSDIKYNKIISIINNENLSLIQQEIEENIKYNDYISYDLAKKAINAFNIKIKKIEQRNQLNENYKILLKAEKQGDINKIKKILINQSKKLKEIQQD